MTTKTELPILPFATAASWEQWLGEHHAQPGGLWIRIAKKGSGIASVTHDEALDLALCYGWIDGQRKGDDANHFLQKFTPRRPKSLWSRRNVEKVAALATAGKIQPPGLAEIEAARRDGRWDAAYESARTMTVPDDFLRALEENEQARTVFGTLNRSNLYAIGWRLKTARTPETRQRRFDALLAMLARGERPIP